MEQTNGCVFCSLDKVELQNDSAFAVFDRYPVSPGHMLVIPKRHVQSFFETTPQEKAALLQLLEDCRRLLIEKHNPDGFNIGVNDGKAAGQTVMHLHVHLIPRYAGDMSDPRGGVRGVIPEKRVYTHR
ncbi:MAG: HIT family protein [Firmicutes bacterium]|jgi:diadenosine tetraphosphate (Ap4A) HIT family hydrolase|nr:HIT family protein [Bacillota bacterium]